MWVFLSNSFLSIVDKDCAPDEVLVRARRAGDIEAAFPEAKVTKSLHNDYRYRATLPRERVAKRLAEEVRQLHYPNFKSTVRDHDRHDAYMATWQAMFDFQARESGKPPPRRR